MKKTFNFWQVAGFGFASVLGTLLHFMFDWCDGNVFIALFSAVNESIWEHMKLLFFPLFIFAWIEYAVIGKKYDNFWCTKLLGTVIGLMLIPTLYYTYSGILGRSIDLINIAIFYIAAAAAFRTESKLIYHYRCNKPSPAASVFIMFLIAGLFVLLTFFPARLPLFQDPITGEYGFQP